MKIWWESLLGEMSKFLASGGTLPPPSHPPSKEKPEKGREKFEKKLNEKMGGLERNSYKTD